MHTATAIAEKMTGLCLVVDEARPRLQQPASVLLPSLRGNERIAVRLLVRTTPLLGLLMVLFDPGGDCNRTRLAPTLS